jgi:MFS family permease
MNQQTQDTATSQKWLYWACFMALGSGTVEAVINPVVGTLYSKEKTKWLNILHAGWPGGMVLGGILILAMGPEVGWEWKVSLIFIPTLIYGLITLSKAAGIIIFLAATIYAFGKTFFWPTMLGVVAERFPKRGALISIFYFKRIGGYKAVELEEKQE